MQQWILSVAGIAILSVLCDIILPDGQTKKYVKTVIGVVVTLAVVQPLFSLFQQGNFAANFPSAEVSAQQNYLDYVAESQQNKTHLTDTPPQQTGRTQAEEIAALTNAFKAAGFSLFSVHFEANTQRYVATFNVNCTQERLQKAQNAALSANCRFGVKFRWNNGSE